MATGLGAGSYWTLHDGSDTWVISNGIDLLGVKGSEVLWEDQLPSGSSEVNGFDTETGPTWAISGGVLLVATPEAMLALDAQTGEEQWRIETEITSWETTDTTLIIAAGTTVAVLPFPDPDESEQLEEGQSGQQTLLLGADTEVIELPTEAEILNSTLNVPFVDKEVDEVKIEQLSFEDGVAREQNEWGPGTETWARMVGYPILDGVPHVLLRFLSSGPGNPGLYKWTVRTDEEGNPQIISVYAYNP